MPHSRGPRIHARTPWDSTEAPVTETGRDPAPTQDVVYECDRCGPVTRRYLEGVAPPNPVTCRCGKDARIPGAPEDDKPETPKYGPHEYRAKGRTAEDVTPWAQLMKRRTVAELEALLAARMAEVRQQGVAR